MRLKFEQEFTKLCARACAVMFKHYTLKSQCPIDLVNTAALMNGYEVTFSNIEDNALIITWGDEDYVKEVLNVLRENDIDVYDWAIRIKTIYNDGKTTKRMRVEFFELAS